jgi:hypothetical protein
VLVSTLSKLEVSILQYYIAHAIQSGRRDKVVELFEMNGNDLLQGRGLECMVWWVSLLFTLLSLMDYCFLDLYIRACDAAISYLKNPNLDPEFHIYFSKER